MDRAPANVWLRARLHGVVATLERGRPDDDAVRRLAALYRRITGKPR